MTHILLPANRLERRRRRKQTFSVARWPLSSTAQSVRCNVTGRTAWPASCGRPDTATSSYWYPPGRYGASLSPGGRKKGEKRKRQLETPIYIRTYSTFYWRRSEKPICRLKIFHTRTTVCGCYTTQQINHYLRAFVWERKKVVKQVLSKSLLIAKIKHAWEELRMLVRHSLVESRPNLILNGIFNNGKPASEATVTWPILVWQLIHCSQIDDLRFNPSTNLWESHI